MNLYKNRTLSFGLTLILTFAMCTSAMPVSADSTGHEEIPTALGETALGIAEATDEIEEIVEEEVEEEVEEVEETTYTATNTNYSSQTSSTTTSYETETYQTSSASSDPLTKQKGVVYYNGHRETYYSQKVLPGGGLDIPGRHVAEDGTVRDGDGYICVASSDLAKGTVVETSLGTAKVYDTGCASGTVDIYTNW